jgi:hypothetical protein
MSELLRNALDSIALGIEDYQANDPKRAISAVRNFYAGALLLAKEVLARAAPDANPDNILGARRTLWDETSKRSPDERNDIRGLYRHT